MGTIRNASTVVEIRISNRLTFLCRLFYILLTNQTHFVIQYSLKAK